MLRAILISAALAMPFAAGAQSITDDALRAQILPGWRTADGTHMAALKLTLADGWKTYWRAPGEAGIAPRFDWSGSENIGQVTFHWPRPEVFDLNGMLSIGYKHELVLPIEFTPVTAGAPMALNAQIELGVCREVCLPVSLRLAAGLPEAGAPDAEIRAALDTRPARRRAAAIHCRIDPLTDGLRLTAEIEIPSSGGDEVTVLEVSDSSVWVSQATTSRVGGRLTATADLVPMNAQPFALERSGITITILGSTRAIELSGCPS